MSAWKRAMSSADWSRASQAALSCAIWHQVEVRKRDLRSDIEGRLRGVVNKQVGFGGVRNGKREPFPAAVGIACPLVVPGAEQPARHHWRKARPKMPVELVYRPQQRLRQRHAGHCGLRMSSRLSLCSQVVVPQCRGCAGHTGSSSRSEFAGKGAQERLSADSPSALRSGSGIGGE